MILCLVLLPLWAEVSLNESGRLDWQKAGNAAEFIWEENEYYIRINGLKLTGNVLFVLPEGYLTLTTEHSNCPTMLRTYNLRGKEIFRQIYKQTINLSFSENKRFVAFATGEKTAVIDLESLDESEYPHSVIFAVDNDGFPAYISHNRIHYQNFSAEYAGSPQKILFQNQNLLFFTSKFLYHLSDDIKIIHAFDDSFFDAEIIGKALYVVEKKIKDKEKQFRLLQSRDMENFTEIQLKTIPIDNQRTHDPIQAPLLYGTGNYAFPIGNSYAEHQIYGTNPYLHPGVDFLGDDFQEVYAVQSGFVKAVLTTGGNAYWRVAVANEDTAAETEGYLYAHLNQNSITVNIGDEVQAGNLLGTLYPWNYYDFTHLHFARIKDEGNFWTGTWWTVDNPLVDVTNLQDSIPPVFENALGDDKFAFRTADGEYLSPFSLQGEFDIIVKCHDLCNSDWRIDVWDISFSLHSHDSPDSTLYELFSYKYDMLLDYYFDDYYTNLALNTIYSQDAVCPSAGNYEIRDYYHIITNSDGDSLITENDEPQIFDSSQFADGLYFFKVRVRDASLNTTVDSMMVYFENGVPSGNDLPEQEIFLTNYPNPFNPSTTISFSLTTEITGLLRQLPDTPGQADDTELVIYNLKGQKVRTLDCCNSFAANAGDSHSWKNARDSRSTYSVIWNGDDDNNQPVSSGIYLYKLKTGTFEKTNKMILMK